MTGLFTRRATVAGLGACFVLLTLPAQAAERTVQHAQGRTRLPATPRRVAVYDLAALDILQSLEVPVAGVPAVRLPDYLSDYGGKAFDKVGSLFEPDMAALRAAAPDLIVVGGRSASKYEELSRVAPTLDLSTGTTDFVASVIRNIVLLGTVFDRQARAEALAAQLSIAVRGLQAQGERAGRGLLLFAVGDGLVPQPPKSRFGVVYELAGIASVMRESDAAPAARRAATEPAQDAAATEAARLQQAAANARRLDEMLARQPDWLFVLDRPAATGGAPIAAGLLAAHPGVAATPAWRRQQVVQLDAPTWYLVGGGYTALRSSVTQMATAFGQRG
ncbi:siderophore ABC transporter substrate-binding protein [Xylophilus sp. GOD-11R]|uniref:siderophore ABC transporter substrate-binding protein n=1 Tax=Xylophilus sp. GOD-11R TaxID=3089814 RepID=UPI00298CF488|nr:ABC transporter substrate-binding protein [Xylophilus sp. GOD-11R]WPB56096.1 ABC transporter substrate-binding protein [Xylophilus sp. GOD-11R]